MNETVLDEFDESRTMMNAIIKNKLIGHPLRRKSSSPSSWK